jgi:hypothetical protein
VAQLVEALRYKSEGRGFDSRWCYNPSGCTMALGLTQPLTEISLFSGSAAHRGLWAPRPREFVITHNDAPQSVGLLWKSVQLVAETST